MNEAFAAASILFLIYVSQCFGSFPPISVVFLLNDRLKGHLLRRFWDTGPLGRRIFLLNPFLPHVGAVYSDRIPFVVGREEDGNSVWLEAHTAAGDSRETLTFAELHEIEAIGKGVIVDGRDFLTLRSEAVAEGTADFLNQLQRTPGESRLSELQKNFRARFAVKALDDRLETYAKSSAYLQASCFALFFFVLLLGPAAVFFLGLHRTWFALLLYVILSGASITWFFVAAHRRIYPQKKRWPLQHITTLAFSPFAAIRANDLLVAELLADFHPALVAQRLLEADEFRRLAEGELRKARFLYRDEFLGGFLEEFLKQNGVEPESLLEAPRKSDAAARTYCPACLMEYVIEAGYCKDCNDTPLARFP